MAIAFKFWMLLGALIIYALGSALPVFTMSLVKSPLISLGHSDTQDFSIVMLTKTLGSLVGAPLMASLWIQAIKIGGLGLGLPYFVSAVRHYVLIGRLLFANLSPDDICSCSSSCCKFALLVRLEPFKSLVFGLMYVDFGDATTRLSRTLVRRNRLCCPSSFFSVLFQPEPCRRKHRMSDKRCVNTRWQCCVLDKDFDRSLLCKFILSVTSSTCHDNNSKGRQSSICKGNPMCQRSSVYFEVQQPLQYLFTWRSSRRERSGRLKNWL